ncbi:MAG: DUF4041 domain-containing protein [Planctomycetota bacterium]|nr:DUF4041 domain-containing protein [Planctomycetota bacterium]
MAVGILLLLVLVLGVGLAFAISQVVTYQARLQQAAVITDFERQKRTILQQVEAAEGDVAELRKSAASYERQLEALKQRLAPGERALDLERTTKELADRVREQEGLLEALRLEVESVEEAREIQAFGLYRPRYDLASSAEYQAKLEAVREQQKQLVKSEQAAHCPSNWTVDGSAAKGKKMVAEQVKLMLRAFNGECDAAIAKVKYNNAVTLENRIKKSFEAINKLGQSKGITITQEYLVTKLEELHLVHELQEKVHAEREAQRAIKEQVREEERAQRELDEAKSKAEREAALQEAALERARRELAESTGKQHEKLEELVTRLELELKDAIDRKAKAIARAQLTRSGHVYVISNIGSFGEGCFKIGLTRRLDPMERVWELGDASVPFEFDVHAMIFSEDAPELENALHRRFAERRVNKVNTRKEFFRVSLEEIRQAVTDLHGTITFVTVPEAEEYRKTVALEREAAPAPVRLSTPRVAAPA